MWNLKKQVQGLSCGSPVVKTLGFHCRGEVSISGQETEILYATWCVKKIKIQNIIIIHKGTDELTY